MKPSTFSQTLTIESLTETYVNRYPNSKQRFTVCNPASNECLGSLPTLVEADVQGTLVETQQAFQLWKESSVFVRSELLHTLVRLMEDNHTELATIISLENGKPFAEAQGEVSYSIGFFRWFANSVVRLRGYIAPSTTDKLKVEVQYKPVGVCASITPWNFPLAMLAKKAAAALAAGCGLVCKPAEETPFSALALMTLVQRAGFPKHLLSVVVGDAPQIGKTLCHTSFVRKLSFTGSTEVGKILMRQSASTLQKLSMELGGNAPFVVLESADLQTVCSSMLRSKFRNCGQACISANRFIVHERVHTQFLDLALEAIQPLKVGSAWDDFGHTDVNIGPLISIKAVEKIQRLIDDAVCKGATIVFGERPTTTNNFVSPIVFTGLTPDMDIWWEEVFGPVIAICTVPNTKRAVELANQSHHGLGAYVFTTDPLEIESVPPQIECGMVGVNTGAISMPHTPFGGVKLSGFGREGGVEGLFEYLNTQMVARQF